MASKRKLVYITVEIAFVADRTEQEFEIPLVPIKGLIHRIKATSSGGGNLAFFLAEGDWSGTFGVPDDGLIKLITRSASILPTFPIDIQGDTLVGINGKVAPGNQGIPYQLPMVGDPGAKLGIMYLTCDASVDGDVVFQLTIEPMVS